MAGLILVGRSRFVVQLIGVGLNIVLLHVDAALSLLFCGLTHNPEILS